MESTMSLIKQFSTSKEGVENFIYKTVNEVKSGLVNPLELTAYLKAIELCLDGIRAEIKDDAIREHSKYHLKTIKEYGFEIEQSEAGIRYDYTYDDVWNRLTNDIENLNTVRKQRESILKLGVTDSEGEIIIQPANKKSTTCLKFSLK
jgi:hypothetical protein